MNDLIHNLVLKHLVSICIMAVCMVTYFMGSACNHSLLLILISSQQTNKNIFRSMYSTECIHKYEKWIQLKMKKQQQQANRGKFNANSETVTTLIPSVSVPAAGIWNGKICLLREEWLRLPFCRCNCPPPLKNKAHSMDSTVIFTSALHKLLSGI